jgi:aminopeptidase N
MYYKGGNLLHTLRHMINDTERWRGILRGLNRDFRHQTVTTEQIEQYLERESGLELSKFFDQYLRSTDIPVFEYQIEGNRLHYRFGKVVEGFSIPLRVRINGEEVTLYPTGEIQVLEAQSPIGELEVDRNFYVLAEQVKF